TGSLFPTLLLGGGTFTKNKIRRRLDVSQPRRSVSALQLIGKHEGQCNLIKLQAAADRAPIDPGILRKTAVSLLLYVEEIIERPIGTGAIAQRQKRRRYLIKIARPNRMIATNRRFVCVWPTTPGNGWRSDHCTAIGLIFQAF